MVSIILTAFSRAISTPTAIKGLQLGYSWQVYNIYIQCTVELRFGINIDKIRLALALGKKEVLLAVFFRGIYVNMNQQANQQRCFEPCLTTVEVESLYRHVLRTVPVEYCTNVQYCVLYRFKVECGPYCTVRTENFSDEGP